MTEPSHAATPPTGANRRPGSLVSRVKSNPALPITVSVVLLFAVLSPLAAPSSISGRALPSLAVFSTVLALAAAGQTFVIQQRGFDLSVSGAISLAGVCVVHFGHSQNGHLTFAIFCVAGFAVGSGIVVGLAVVVLRITPLIATLGMNAVLMAIGQAISEGVATRDVPPALNKFATGSTLGLPNPAWIGLIVVAVAWFAIKATTFGRRFEAAGANPRAAWTAGSGSTVYSFAAYIMASVCYAAAGVLLAGYVNIPSVDSGTSYLFPSVTAVVLGGVAITGGQGSIIASAIGAVFLTQLDTVVVVSGANASLQYIIQAAIIAVGVMLKPVSNSFRSLLTSRRLSRTDSAVLQIPAKPETLPANASHHLSETSPEEGEKWSI